MGDWILQRGAGFGCCIYTDAYIWSSVIMSTELVGWRKAALSLHVKVVMQTPLPAAPCLLHSHQMPFRLLRGEQAGGSQMLHKLHEVANYDGCLESMW